MMKYLFIFIFVLLSFKSNVSYAQWVRVSNLEDITLETINTMNGKTRKVEISTCAYEIFDSDNKYWLEVNDGDANGVLELTDTITGNKIPMRVRWRQANGRIKNLVESAPKAFNGTTGIINCTSGDNAGLEIRVLKADTAGIPAGTYTARLSITMYAKAP